MKRIEIRNHNSDRPTKPRVFDALLVGGTVFLEVKNGRVSERIDLKDVMLQIDLAKRKSNSTGTTEP